MFASFEGIPRGGALQYMGEVFDGYLEVTSSALLSKVKAINERVAHECYKSLYPPSRKER